MPPLAPDSAAVQDSTAYRRELIRPTLYRRVKWRAELCGFVAFEVVLGGLPLAWSAHTGRFLGGLAHLLLKRRRATVRRNLRIAFAGERTGDALDAMTEEVFRRSGANLLCSFRTARLSAEGLAKAVSVRDEALFQAAAGKGAGVVMVLAHMGNWEALAQWFPKLLPEGVAGATVYRPLNNPLINARVAAQRNRLGVGLFSKDDNPLGMASFLRRGGVLGVLADQRAGSIGELVPFFGRITSCTPIPAILARRTGAAVLGVSLRTLGPGRWELRFHACDETAPTTERVMRLVETMMRVSPEDVFWLQDRWKVSRGTPWLEPGKPARGGTAIPAKKRRALVMAGSEPPLSPSGDVEYERAGGSAGSRWRREVTETATDFLRRVDAGDALPIDYIVGGGPEVRRACRELGIVWTEWE